MEKPTPINLFLKLINDNSVVVYIFGPPSLHIVYISYLHDGL